jgi:hypothetical protein
MYIISDKASDMKVIIRRLLGVFLYGFQSRMSSKEWVSRYSFERCLRLMFNFNPLALIRKHRNTRTTIVISFRSMKRRVV